MPWQTDRQTDRHTHTDSLRHTHTHCRQSSDREFDDFKNTRLQNTRSINKQRQIQALTEPIYTVHMYQPSFSNQ